MTHHFLIDGGNVGREGHLHVTFNSAQSSSRSKSLVVTADVRKPVTQPQGGSQSCCLEFRDWM